MAEKQNDERKDKASQDAPVEPSVTLQAWASRNARETVDGIARPLNELMGGFVHEEQAAGRRVGKPSEFRARFAAFRTRKL
jgi:hypothetical protein